MENTTEDQKQTLFYRLLSTPQLYILSQNIFNKNNVYRTLVNEYIKPQPGVRILDIGCGTADIVNFIPDGVKYVGFDINSRYIKYAQNRYRDKVELHCKRINEADAASFNEFDYVLSVGVVHHIGDQEAIKLFQLGSQLLKKGGKMITCDPTFNDSDNFFAKFMTNNDRGEHVRIINNYKKLADEVFNSVKAEIRKDMLNVAQSECVMVSQNI